MQNNLLHITLIQPDMVWEDKKSNLDAYESTIENIKEKKQIVVLPEMFTTGFSMQPAKLAEPMEGPSVQWMALMARKHRCIVTGSLMIAEDDKFYNRMIWMQPDGVIGYYDKRHLFGFAHEDKYYSRGDNRLIVQVNGWRILLQVCYDLRFPEWARNTGTAYDVLLYVANWPKQRSLAWKTLLRARAIENQSYVIGVNRVGTDPKGNIYSGDSCVIGPLGEEIWQHSDTPACHTIILDGHSLVEKRKEFPFLNDADKFMIID